MKAFSNQKGLTLVEIIVSIAILGIIAVGFLPAFSSAFGMICHAGNKSEALYAAQKEIENLISDKTIITSPVAVNNGTMTITGTVTQGFVTVNGHIIQGRNIQVEVVYNSSNQNVVLKTFVAD